MESFHRWVKCLLEGLEARVDGALLAEVLVSCGRGCIPVNFIDRMVKVWRETADLGVLIDKINDSWSGVGADAHVVRGDGELMVEYGECYCPLVKDGVRELPLIWCECSRGWLMQLFESVLGEKVEVELLESVQMGGDKCRFKIISEGVNY